MVEASGVDGPPVMEVLDVLLDFRLQLRHVVLELLVRGRLGQVVFDDRDGGPGIEGRRRRSRRALSARCTGGREILRLAELRRRRKQMKRIRAASKAPRIALPMPMPAAAPGETLCFTVGLLVAAGVAEDVVELLPSEGVLAGLCEVSNEVAVADDVSALVITPTPGTGEFSIEVKEDGGDVETLVSSISKAAAGENVTIVVRV